MIPFNPRLTVMQSDLRRKRSIRLYKPLGINLQLTRFQILDFRFEAIINVAGNLSDINSAMLKSRTKFYNIKSSIKNPQC